MKVIFSQKMAIICNKMLNRKIILAEIISHSTRQWNNAGRNIQFMPMLVLSNEIPVLVIWHFDVRPKTFDWPYWRCVPDPKVSPKCFW